MPCAMATGGRSLSSGSQNRASGIDRLRSDGQDNECGQWVENGAACTLRRRAVGHVPCFSITSADTKHYSSFTESRPS